MPEAGGSSLDPKYGDIGDPWGNPLQMDGGGGSGGWGGGGFTSPFIPTSFSGGAAQPFGGFPSNPFAGGFQRRIMRGPSATQNAFSGNAVSGGRTAAPSLGFLDWTRDWLRERMPGQTQPPGTPAPSAPFNPATEQFNSVFDIINNLLTHGVRGDIPGYGGAFSLNPPPEIMGALRQSAVSDAGAQQRAARLGIQSRGDIDPSTYGFQSLMSDLQGQRGVSDFLNRANLGLRQGQLDQYWGLLRALLGEQGAGERANVAARAADQGFDWGSLIPQIPGFGGGGSRR